MIFANSERFQNPGAPRRISPAWSQRPNDFLIIPDGRSVCRRQISGLSESEKTMRQFKLHWMTCGLAMCLTTAAAMSGSDDTQGSTNNGPLIVHEWGTFTTFSGSDGVHLDFRPLRDQDLPLFVMNRASQSGYIWLGKSRIRTRVRMETPVTYFYTDRERTIQASVGFPQGLLTEFYPPVTSMAPAFNQELALEGEGEPIGNSSLAWGDINLIPMTSLRPEISDDRTASWMQDRFAQSILPDASDNHYAHARNTDSALVHVHRSAPAKDVERNANLLNAEVSAELLPWLSGAGPGANSSGDGLAHVLPGDFFEKFLFYRGVGKFDVPVNVISQLNGRLTVSNLGEQPLRRMLLLNVTGGTLRYSFLSDVQPAESIQTTQPQTEVSLEGLRDIVKNELVDAGLYTKEAQAMVDTWTTSWFTEQGTRLFYLVPQELTETVLPLTITPRPDEMLRVMVGRIEIMSASQEQQLLTVLRRSAEQRAQMHAELAANGAGSPADLPLPTEFFELGRLAEPALCRLREICPDRTVQAEADALIRRLRADVEAEEAELQKSAQAAL
jgi:hypothetical protein